MPVDGRGLAAAGVRLEDLVVGVSMGTRGPVVQSTADMRTTLALLSEACELVRIGLIRQAIAGESRIVLPETGPIVPGGKGLG